MIDRCRAALQLPELAGLVVTRRSRCGRRRRRPCRRSSSAGSMLLSGLSTGPGLGNAVVGNHPLGAVGSEERHPVAGLHAQRGQDRSRRSSRRLSSSPKESRRSSTITAVASGIAPSSGRNDRGKCGGHSLASLGSYLGQLMKIGVMLYSAGTRQISCADSANDARGRHSCPRRLLHLLRGGVCGRARGWPTCIFANSKGRRPGPSRGSFVSPRGGPVTGKQRHADRDPAPSPAWDGRTSWRSPRCITLDTRPLRRLPRPARRRSTPGCARRGATAPGSGPTAPAHSSWPSRAFSTGARRRRPGGSTGSSGRAIRASISSSGRCSPRSTG